MNVTVGSTVAFAGQRAATRISKALAKAHRATLNDMVLMLCAGRTAASYLPQPRSCRARAWWRLPIFAAPAPETPVGQPGLHEPDQPGHPSADPAQAPGHILAASSAMKPPWAMKSVSCPPTFRPSASPG